MSYAWDSYEVLATSGIDKFSIAGQVYQPDLVTVEVLQLYEDIHVIPAEACAQSL